MLFLGRNISFSTYIALVVCIKSYFWSTKTPFAEFSQLHLAQGEFLTDQELKFSKNSNTKVLKL